MPIAAANTKLWMSFCVTVEDKVRYPLRFASIKMLGESKLALKLPVHGTLCHRNPSTASEMDGKTHPQNKTSDKAGKRVNDAIGAPPSALPSIKTAAAAGENDGTTTAGRTVEVHPITIRKTPKFPSRERHLAIRRKRATNAQVEELQLSIAECGDCEECPCDKDSERGDNMEKGMADVSLEG